MEKVVKFKIELGLPFWVFLTLCINFKWFA